MSVEPIERPGSPELSPFDEISRSDWAALAASTELPLTEDEIERIQGLGDRLDLDEVREVYLPLSQLLNMYVRELQSLHASQDRKSTRLNSSH